MSEEFIEDILAKEEPPNLEPSKVIDDSSKIEDSSTKKTEVKEEIEVDESSKKDDSDITIETLATQIGWRPDYKGEDQVDAATFILKSREIQETMKEHNKDLKNLNHCNEETS